MKKNISAFVEKIIKTVNSNRKIFVFGSGRSGKMIQAFAQRLIQLEIDVYVVGETMIPLPKKEDLFILMSSSGETPAAVFLEEAVKKEVGSYVIVISSSSQSRLRKEADLTIKIPGGHKLNNKKREISYPLGHLLK